MAPTAAASAWRRSPGSAQHDVVDAHGPQHGDGQRADRAGAEHQRGLPGRARRPGGSPWSATASGSASAAARGSSPSGIGSSSAAGCHLVGGEGALLQAHARGVALARTATAGRRGRRGRCRSGPSARRPRRRPRSSRSRRPPTAATRADPLVALPAAAASPQPSRTMCRSLPQMPQRSTSTSTSSVADGRHGHVTDLEPPGPVSTAAAIRSGSSCSSDTRVTILRRTARCNGPCSARCDAGCQGEHVAGRRGRAAAWGEAADGRCAVPASPAPRRSASLLSVALAGRWPRTTAPDGPAVWSRQGRHRRGLVRRRSRRPAAGPERGSLHRRSTGCAPVRHRPPDRPGLAALPGRRRPPGAQPGLRHLRRPRSRPRPSRSSTCAPRTTTRSASTPTPANPDGQTSRRRRRLGQAHRPDLGGRRLRHGPRRRRGDHQRRGHRGPPGDRAAGPRRPSSSCRSRSCSSTPRWRTSTSATGTTGQRIDDGAGSWSRPPRRCRACKLVGGLIRIGSIVSTSQDHRRRAPASAPPTPRLESAASPSPACRLADHRGRARSLGSPSGASGPLQQLLIDAVNAAARRPRREAHAPRRRRRAPTQTGQAVASAGGLLLEISLNRRRAAHRPRPARRHRPQRHLRRQRAARPHRRRGAASIFDPDAVPHRRRRHRPRRRRSARATASPTSASLPEPSPVRARRRRAARRPPRPAGARSITDLFGGRLEPRSTSPSPSPCWGCASRPASPSPPDSPDPRV